jgi:hypothetical protein
VKAANLPPQFDIAHACPAWYVWSFRPPGEARTSQSPGRGGSPPALLDGLILFQDLWG